MSPRAWTSACTQALDPASRAIFEAGGVDAADAWLAQIEGKTNAQARAQARRLRGSAVISPGQRADASWLHGTSADPALVLESAEAAASLDQDAVTAAGVAADFEATGTLGHAQKMGKSQRRIQQIFKARRDLADLQLEIDFEREGDE
ncbi:hypothetical protein THICB3510054 [Thiomonas sp. CB3]|nr:hypothetical protein THICB3510054 [Thiomonas sp. CB3]